MPAESSTLAPAQRVRHWRVYLVVWKFHRLLGLVGDHHRQLNVVFHERSSGREICRQPVFEKDASATGNSPMRSRAPLAPRTLSAARGPQTLSPGTVRNYLSEAMGKLGATNRVAAARVARERGWL